MTTPNEELLALADRYATLRIGEGTANARKELQNALRSQAERIAELECESETHAKAYGLAIVERNNLRAELAELVEALEYHIEQTRPIERSTIALSKYKGAK